MSEGRAWPFGQTRWDAFAKELTARVSLLQIHVESDFLFAVCTRCGWDLEKHPSDIPAFRHQVASHHCGQLPLVPVESVELPEQIGLF